MWPISDRFVKALKAPHKYKTTCTITPPGGAATEVQIKSGTLTVDGRNRIRRRARLQLTGTTPFFESLVVPGSIFDISHGITYGRSEELVPVFHGEAVQGSQVFGDGTLTLTLADQGATLAACRFTTPYAPLPTTTRVAAIEHVVTTAIGGATVSNLSSDAGTIGSDQVWTGGPIDVIAQLTRDGGTEAFFGPDGIFYIRDLPTPTTPTVWTAGSGAGGVLKAAERTRPLDQLYNRVVVRPSGTDQGWTQQVATITDTESPIHESKINTRTYEYSSPTVQTATDAITVATQILNRFTGLAETLTLEAIANPALEANDAIRVITPTAGTQPAAIFQHYIDSYDLSLTSGDMRLATRSQAVTND